jgi:hypothetical protein
MQITSTKASDLLNKDLAESFVDLEEIFQNESITKTAYDYAKEVIIALDLLEQKKETFSAIIDENLRNIKVTEVTKLVAEPFLIPGENPEEIKHAIEVRINEFIRAYRFDKKENLLNQFFAKAFIGPPCFNGRITTMQQYAKDNQAFEGELFFPFVTDYDLEANALSNIMYECCDHFKLKKAPSIKELEEFSQLDCISAETSRTLNEWLNSSNANKIYVKAFEFYVN